MEAGALLLPGLPNELAMQCLIHVPDGLLWAMNRSWRRLLLSDDTFRSIRLSQGHSTALFLAVAPKCRLPCEDVHTDNPSYRCFEIDVTTNNQPSNYWRLISTLCEREGRQIFKSGHKCVGLGSLVLVIGGKDFNTDRTGSAAVHALDRATGRWHKRASMESPRMSRFAAVTHKRRYVFVFGGYIEHEEGFEYLQKAEVYDSLPDKWSPIASIPVPLHNIHASFLIQERIFIEGSVKGALGYHRVVFSYDINLGTWQEETRIAKKIRALGYDSSPRHYSVLKLAAALNCNSVTTATLSCSLVAAVLEPMRWSHGICDFDYLSLYKLENVLDEGLQRDNPSSSQVAECQLSDNLKNDTDDEAVGWKMILTGPSNKYPRTLWTLEEAIAEDPSVDLVLVTTIFSPSKQENVSIDAYYLTPKILNVITCNFDPCSSAVVSVVL
ncbi:hypothetical protein GOP47_0011766 [Adiantum capillus-veneris]|uniref:F-box/kelch-repeat protein n=1 Tax=Adiantum capillus-veneris TaxID=13818 RepID=A0A9D4UTD9_ADICA|nr:hypothetical protein GOP47_0011766 [Adiantum capillus-veneris]